MGKATTLFQKVWERHEVVPQTADTPAVLYIDLHLIHEVTTPQAFSELRTRGLQVRRRDRTLGTMDHSTPTRTERPADLLLHWGPLLLPLAALACAPRAAGEQHTTPDQATPQGCRPLAPIGRPALPEAGLAPQASAGELWLTLDVPLSAIEREVERYVPRTLAAEEDRPIGAPGRVTYRVTRGRPKLSAKDGRLSATLPVKIDLSLCKPFGSLCIGYGSCTPAYDVKASWDLTLNAQHELADVRLSQKVTQGCSVGIDVTDHVTQVVKEQLRGVAEQIDERLPPLSPFVDRAIFELTRPTMLAAGQCIAFSPTEVLLAGPTTSEGRFFMGVGLSGTMLEAECDAPPHPGRGLPVRRREQAADSPRLQLRQHVSQAALRTALDEAVVRASSPALGLAVRDHTMTRDGVLLELELSGSACGIAWAEVKLGVQEDHLSVDAARLHQGGLLPAQAAELEAALVGPLRVGSVAPRWVAELAVEERTDILGTLLRERGELDLSVSSPRVMEAEVITEVDGIWVLSGVQTRLGLKAQDRPTP